MGSIAEQDSKVSPMLSQSLSDAVSELGDCCDDFEHTGYQNADSVLVRFLNCVDREPLASLAEAILPEVDFAKWWQACQDTKGGMVGSGSLNWPRDRSARVAMQLQLCRAIARKEADLLGVALDFCYAGSTRFDDNLLGFSNRVLRPLLRDFAKLAELRVSPPIMAESLAVLLPDTGDALLDQLLRMARDGFRDKNPATRRLAVEKLWDAWERIKTLERSGNKRLSTTILLDRAASDPAFRKLLETEAAAITAIGNQFHIRHFETDKFPIDRDSHVDYLFHRLWALLWLLLTVRLDAGPSE